MMKKQKFTVEGMSCAVCQSHVQKAVSKLPGVQRADVNLLTREMDVEYDEARQSAASISQAVSDAGYGATPADEQAEADPDDAEIPGRSEAARLGRRVLFSLIFLLPLSYLAMGAMLGLPRIPYLADPAHTLTFAFVQLALLIPILIWNRAFFSAGFRTLAHGAPNMDSLIAVGAGAGVAYSLFVTARMFSAGGDAAVLASLRGDLYFEAAGMILVLITFGKYLEMKSRGRTGDAIAKLMSLAPKTALVEKNGAVDEIPVANIAIGDILVLRAGASVAADGVAVSGNASLDQSAVTGESVPVEKSAGMAVVSGSVCTAGFLRFRAEKVGSETTLAKVVELVREAANSKAPISRLADRVSSVFVPVVIAVSAVTFAVWLLVGAGVTAAVSSAIAVLVVSCPCALGLATPVAIMVGTGRAAEFGILFKNAESLENLHRVGIAVFDKTGTLTEGRPAVSDLLPAPGETEESLLTLAAAVERFSEHPFARAVMKLAESKKFSVPESDSFRAIPGQGVTAETVSSAGAKIRIAAGNLAFLRASKSTSPALEAAAEEIAAEGRTPLFFLRGETVVGLMAFADPLKEDAAEAVARLEKRHIHAVMLTGDNAVTARAVARLAGIDEVAADVLPAGKEAAIRRVESESGKKVAMIGDGVNDAPALARADVGIAIGAGTEIAVEAADVVLSGRGLLNMVRALELSGAVIGNIRMNLFWAFFYNVLGIPLAAGVFVPFFGWRLSPMFGALAMSLSSVCVVVNALRLRRWKPDF